MIELPKNIEDWYTDYLKRHISAVQTAGRWLGLSDQQLARHDDSKWSVAEFAPYALYHYGIRTYVAEYAFAWMHHLHENPHHWQHWIFANGWTLDGADIEPGGVMRMHDKFAIEMVADWLGTGFALFGSWDISDWLSRNMSRITLHSQTAELVRETLVGVDWGYYTTVNEGRWAQEILTSS